MSSQSLLPYLNQPIKSSCPVYKGDIIWCNAGGECGPLLPNRHIGDLEPPFQNSRTLTLASLLLGNQHQPTGFPQGNACSGWCFRTGFWSCSIHAPEWRGQPHPLVIDSCAFTGSPQVHGFHSMFRNLHSSYCRCCRTKRCKPVWVVIKWTHITLEDNNQSAPQQRNEEWWMKSAVRQYKRVSQKTHRKPTMKARPKILRHPKGQKQRPSQTCKYGHGCRLWTMWQKKDILPGNASQRHPWHHRGFYRAGLRPHISWWGDHQHAPRVKLMDREGWNKLRDKRIKIRH